MLLLFFTVYIISSSTIRFKIDFEPILSAFKDILSPALIDFILFIVTPLLVSGDINDRLYSFLGFLITALST